MELGEIETEVNEDETNIIIKTEEQIYQLCSDEILQIHIKDELVDNQEKVDEENHCKQMKTESANIEFGETKVEENEDETWKEVKLDCDLYILKTEEQIYQLCSDEIHIKDELEDNQEKLDKENNCKQMESEYANIELGEIKAEENEDETWNEVRLDCDLNILKTEEQIYQLCSDEIHIKDELEVNQEEIDEKNNCKQMKTEAANIELGEIKAEENEDETWNEVRLDCDLNRANNILQNYCDSVPTASQKEQYLDNVEGTYTNEEPSEEPFKGFKNILYHTIGTQFPCQVCDYKDIAKFYITNLLHDSITQSYKRIGRSVQITNVVDNSRTHTTVKPIECHLCKYRCAGKLHLRLHMTTHTGKYKSSLKADLMTNFQTRLDKNPSDVKRDIIQHDQIQKPFFKTSYECHVCKYRTAFKSDLIRHIQTHSHKLYVCDICKYRSSCKSYLIKHLQSHEQTLQNTYECHVCKYRTAYKAHLVRHIQTHNRQKPYICHLCKYQSGCQSHLNKHLQIHKLLVKNSYECYKCKYRTALKSNLVRHIQNYNHNPYVCPLCNYQNRCKSYLIKHLQSHEQTLQNTYECHVCKYRTAYKPHLVRHIQTHSRQKLYICHLCKYQSRYKSYLTKHLKNHKQTLENP